jgi:hypothetical protein
MDKSLGRSRTLPGRAGMEASREREAVKKSDNKRLEDQEMLCFHYHENLQSILQDLEAIDKLVPREVSRYAPASLHNSKDAIIQGRKVDLLKYVQTICRDHLLYSRQMMDDLGCKDAPWRPSLKPQKVRDMTIPYFREDQVGWKK